MAGEPIRFDSDQFDRLIAQVQGLVSDLESATSGSAGTLGPDLLLQPGLQKWNVSGDMVRAGVDFGTQVGAQGEGLLANLETLNDALAAARTVFNSATDLATYSASQWAEDFPDLTPETPQ